jgi:hypothetical protein
MGLRERRDRAVRTRENPAGALTEATSDSLCLPDVVAQRAAEIFDGVCAILLCSEDGLCLTAKAVFAADPELLRRAREAFEPPRLVDALAADRHTLASGDPVIAPQFDLEPVNAVGVDIAFSEAGGRP